MQVTTRLFYNWNIHSDEDSRHSKLSANLGPATQFARMIRSRSSWH